MNEPKFLMHPSIVPVMMLEPPGMFDKTSRVPSEPEALQRLFRQATKGTGLSDIAFVPGSELLLPVVHLLPHLDEVALICSHEVATIGDAELAGGYAFLDSGFYVFGVEDDSTLYNTAHWDTVPQELSEQGHAVIYHACDQFMDVRLESDFVLLAHSRTKREYRIAFEEFKTLLFQASRQLCEFARKFAPVYERQLAEHLPPAKAREAAYDNFRGWPQWFNPSNKGVSPHY